MWDRENHVSPSLSINEADERAARDRPAAWSGLQHRARTESPAYKHERKSFLYELSPLGIVDP